MYKCALAFNRWTIFFYVFIFLCFFSFFCTFSIFLRSIESTVDANFVDSFFYEMINKVRNLHSRDCKVYVTNCHVKHKSFGIHPYMCDKKMFYIVMNNHKINIYKLCTIVRQMDLLFLY